MLIRSQNRELTILEFFTVLFIDQDDMMTVYDIYARMNQENFLIGEYSTKEKAEKVLDMITAHMAFEKSIGSIFQMPKDEEVENMEFSEQTQDVCGNVECAYNTGGKCPAAEGCGGYEEADEKC